MVAVLADVILPDSVTDLGVRGRTKRKNTRTANQAGYVQANIVWLSSLREYEIGFAPMSIAAWAELEAIFEATYGGAYGMLLEDPKDFECTHANGIIALDGSDWRLYKQYAVASNSFDRKITRPRTGVEIKINGSVDATATVSTETGIVTFITPPEEGDTVTWSGLFYVPVQFQNDELQFEMLAGGDGEERIVHGPSVTLVEVRE